MASHAEEVERHGHSRIRRPEPWAWHPELPIGIAPVFAWPPKPVEAAKYLLGRGLLLSPIVIYFLLSACIWLWLTPAPERWATFEAGWVAQVFAVNLGLVVLVAGSLHLFFHTFRGQRDRRRFDLAAIWNADNPRFFAERPGPGQHLLDLCERRDDHAPPSRFP